MLKLKNKKIENAIPLTQQVYDILYQRICHFDLKPFQMLSESFISENLGISRTPAREALAKLAERGLVEILPQRGTRVAPLRMADLIKSQFMREALEVALLRRAIASPDSDILVKKMRTEIILQKTYIDINNIDMFYQSDEEFHGLIAHFAQLYEVLPEIRRIKYHMDRFRHLVVSSVEDLSIVVTQHTDIVDAIEEKNYDVAEICMLKHLRRIFIFINAVRHQFPEYFEADSK
ncbi:MAG: GntR family transcriptional regulator [Ostreibacterium sp.]